MTQLSRRGVLLAGGGLASAAALSGCGLMGPKKPLTKGTATPKGDVLAKDWFFESKDSYSSASAVKGTPSSTVFRTPHFGMQCKQFSVTDKLDRTAGYGLDLDGDGPWRPADGYEFLFVEFKSGIPPFTDDGSTKFAFVIDGKKHDLGSPFGAFDDNKYSPSYQVSSKVYGMSVPKDKPVTFEVTDQGKTAKLDARTCKLIKDADTDACAPFNQSATATIASKSYDCTIQWKTDGDNTHASRSGTLTLYTDIQSATLLAWTPDGGWAKSGKAYAQVVCDVRTYSSTGNMQIGLKDTFSVKADGADGVLVKDATFDLLKDASGLDGYHAVLQYEVPATTKAIDFTVAYQAPVTITFTDGQVVTAKDVSRSAPFTTKISFS